MPAVLARLDPTLRPPIWKRSKPCRSVSWHSRLPAGGNGESDIQLHRFRSASGAESAILRAAIAEYNYKIEGYRAGRQVAKSRSDVGHDRLNVVDLEKMRNEPDRLGVGKVEHAVGAGHAGRMQRNLDSVEQVGNSAQRDLGALIAERNGYVQSWHADVAEKLAEATSKLSDARESFNKAQLKRQLVELRAEQDATVLTIGRGISPGSVLTAGQQLISSTPPTRRWKLVPTSRAARMAVRRGHGRDVRHVPVYAIRHGAWRAKRYRRG